MKDYLEEQKNKIASMVKGAGGGKCTSCERLKELEQENKDLKQDLRTMKYLLIIAGAVKNAEDEE